MGLCCAIVRARLTGFPQEDIEECVSDVFLEVYRSRGKIELEKGGIRAFLAVVAVSPGNTQVILPPEDHQENPHNLYP